MRLPAYILSVIFIFLLGLGAYVTISLVVDQARARPAPEGWINYSRNIHNPVEQQTPGGAGQPDPSLWVVNPTNCHWDTDDTSTTIGFAKLAPGESTSHTDCVIADVKRRIAAHACASKGNGAITLSLGVTTPVGYQKHSVTIGDGCVTICMIGPAYPMVSPYMQEIPDSNGGLGVPTDVTVTLTNEGKGKRQLSAALYVTHRNNYNHLCGTYPGPQWEGPSYDPTGMGPVIQWAEESE